MLSSILILDADGVHVRHAAAPRLPDGFTRAVDGASIGPSAGSCGTAAYRREPVIVDDIASDPLWADYRDLALPYDLRACWSTPIFDRKWQVLGTVRFILPHAGTSKQIAFRYHSHRYVYRLCSPLCQPLATGGAAGRSLHLLGWNRLGDSVPGQPFGCDAARAFGNVADPMPT